MGGEGVANEGPEPGQGHDASSAASSAAWAFNVLAVALLVLVALPYMREVPSLWGLDLPRFLPPRARSFCIVAAVAMALLHYVGSYRNGRSWSRFIGPSLFMLVPLGLWVWRSRTLLYGDGLALASGIVSASPLPRNEPLSQLAQELVFFSITLLPSGHALAPFRRAVLSTATVSLACGILSMLLLWRIALHSSEANPKTPGLRHVWPVMAIIVAQGHWEIFAGYAENYPVLVPAMLLYVLLATSDLQRDHTRARTGAILGVACLFHSLALVLWPSWVVLARRYPYRSSGPRRAGHELVIAGMPGLIWAFGGWALGRWGALDSASGASPAAVVLSIANEAAKFLGSPSALMAHLWSLLNGVLLVGP